MDLYCLRENIKNCRKTCKTPLDFVKRLFWTYSHNLPKCLKPLFFNIKFKYDKPFDKLTFNVRANDADAFIFGEVYDHQFYNIALPSPPITILDLGANVGFVTVYYARLFPNAHIACVEPIPWNIEQLQKNLSLNHVKADVFSAAIATCDGFVNMEIHHKDFGHKIVDDIHALSKNTIKVPAVTIDCLMRKLNWEKIDLLKIDIEGYEAELFSSNVGWLDTVEAVCIEIHDDFCEKDLIQIKEKHGFNTLKNYPGLWYLSR